MKCKQLIIELPFLNQLINDFMATKQELLDTIAAEKQAYTDAIAAKDAEIQALKDQIASTPTGGVAEADLDEVKTAIGEIVP